MKKSALTITISVLLIIVSVFGLVAVGFGVKDCLNIKEYKEEEGKQAEAVGELEEAIGLLKENEEAYLDGIGVYTQGLKDYNSGSKMLSDGYDTYNEKLAQWEEGKATYEEGKKKYEEGKKQYEEGKKALEEGQKMIDENTEAYNEGKAKLAKIEPLLPYVDSYLNFREGTLEGLGGFSSAQAWFVGVVRPIAASKGLDIPADVTDFPEYIQTMVSEGKALIAQYEEGLATLEAGKAQIADAEAQLAAAEVQLAEGKAQLDEGEKLLAEGKQTLNINSKKLADGKKALAEGKASIDQFEDGMGQVDGYVKQIYSQDAVYRHNGDLAIENPEMALGEDFDWYKYNDNGNIAALSNGEAYLDLDKCLEVCTAFRTYVSEQGADVAKELYARIGTYAALAVASIIALAAGVVALIGKACVVPAALAAVFGFGANIYGLFTRYLGYTYPLEDGAYSGSLQLTALIMFAIVAIAFTVIVSIAKAKKKAVKP